jgi:hypothetical protein
VALWLTDVRTASERSAGILVLLRDCNFDCKTLIRHREIGAAGSSCSVWTEAAVLTKMRNMIMQMRAKLHDTLYPLRLVDVDRQP